MVCEKLGVDVKGMTKGGYWAKLYSSY